jgi:hypothetical protein
MSDSVVTTALDAALSAPLRPGSLEAGADGPDLHPPLHPEPDR